jgi:hypothetical protein
MKLIANLKLCPTPTHSAALHQTLKTANAACNWLSGQAWANKTFGQFALHRLAYSTCRTKFGLSAQMAVRCIAKVADAYKLDRKTRRHFRRTAAQPYDARIFRFCSDTEVSLWTMSGRLRHTLCASSIAPTYGQAGTVSERHQPRDCQTYRADSATLRCCDCPRRPSGHPAAGSGQTLAACTTRQLGLLPASAMSHLQSAAGRCAGVGG